MLGELTPQRATGDENRGETAPEQLDRNTAELIQELRVATVGIQVLFAFLLVVPFNQGWKRVGPFDRYAYYVTLLCIAIAAVLLIAPSIHHRLLFRRRQKEYVVELGSRLMIISMLFVTIGFTGILVLISDVVFGSVTAGVAGTLAAAMILWLWFGIPLKRLRDLRRFTARHAGSRASVRDQGQEV